MFFGGAMPWPEIQRVVAVHAIAYRFEFALNRDLIENAEQFIFAKIATVRSIGAVGRVFHLVSFHEFMADPELADKILDHTPVICRETRRKRRNGQCPLP